MSPEKRSALMARIKSKDTLPERKVAQVFAGMGLLWESHVRDLPGKPDFVFREARVVVFVDGDFWHGWRFPLWQDKLSEAWEIKINANRIRDERNRRRLRRMGWTVIRIWEHQINRDLNHAVDRIASALGIEQIRGSEA